MHQLLISAAFYLLVSFGNNLFVRGESCVDLNCSCVDWAAAGECTTNWGFMSVNCRKSCKQCTPPVPTDGCTDSNPNCPNWASAGECRKNPGNMLTNCKKSCGQCVSATCTDSSQDCPYWASIGECEKNPGNMLINCKKSCGQCVSDDCVPPPAHSRSNDACIQYKPCTAAKKQDGPVCGNRWTNRDKKWNKGIIPFVIAPGYTTVELQVIQEAMDEWNSKTCVKFVKRTSEPDYVEITQNDGHPDRYCNAPMGRQSGRQFMKMYGDCMRRAALIHELGHVIGWEHEQQRPDRDFYITIHPENVLPKYRYTYDKYVWEDGEDTLRIPYDFKSVMHYPYYSYAIEPNSPAKPSMTLKDGSIAAISTEQQFLSSCDILKTNLYFNYCK